jgi:hypothetical protein
MHSGVAILVARCNVRAQDFLQKHMRRYTAKTVASVDSAPNSDFEQSLASLGYGFINDRAPCFLDFIVGFQVADGDEDKTKAIVPTPGE